MTTSASLEKRGTQRIAVTLTAHCRIGNRFIRDVIANLSLGGLLLRTRERAKEGTPVRVALALPFSDGPRFCTLVGAVARVERDERGVPCGLGVSFDETEIAVVDLEALEGFLQNREHALRLVPRG
jgi:uncharacterized protein (TIGR02266 family)